MLPPEPNWQMTALFLLALALLICVMKLIARFAQDATPAIPAPRFWPLPSIGSLRRSRPPASIRRVLLKSLLLVGACGLSYRLYDQWARTFDIRSCLLSYGAAPILWLVAETLSALVRLLPLPGGRGFPALHNRPVFASSLADFWGKRWNLWFSDWFRHVIFRPLRRRPMLAMLSVFAVSGLMHEWVINVPLYVVTGRILFGSMLAYFLMQAAGVWVERRFFRELPRTRRVFTWLVVIGPAPWMLNEGLLRALQLWPDGKLP